MSICEYKEWLNTLTNTFSPRHRDYDPKQCVDTMSCLADVYRKQRASCKSGRIRCQAYLILSWSSPQQTNGPRDTQHHHLYRGDKRCPRLLAAWRADTLSLGTLHQVKTNDAIWISQQFSQILLLIIIIFESFTQDRNTWCQRWVALTFCTTIIHSLKSTITPKKETTHHPKLPDYPAFTYTKCLARRTCENVCFRAHINTRCCWPWRPCFLRHLWVFTVTSCLTRRM